MRQLAVKNEENVTIIIDDSNYSLRSNTWFISPDELNELITDSMETIDGIMEAGRQDKTAVEMKGHTTDLINQRKTIFENAERVITGVICRPEESRRIWVNVVETLYDDRITDTLDEESTITDNVAEKLSELTGLSIDCSKKLFANMIATREQEREE